MSTYNIRADAQAAMVTSAGGANTARRISRLPRLVAALVLFTAVLGIASVRDAHAKGLVPFLGTFSTVSAGAPCGPLTVCVTAEGEGQTTHLGQTTMTKSVVLHLTSDPCPGGTFRSYTVEQTLTAANGDTLSMSGSGMSCAGPDGVVASGTFNVTGGTGRFIGAVGKVSELVVRVGPIPAPETVTLYGSISSSGSGR